MQNIYTEEFKQIGVYEIKNKINEKCYIGSTTMSFQKRLEHHRCLLRLGTHKNTYLQNAWNKYGEDNFEFNILEVVDKCCTLDREQVYLDECLDCYNINPLASGTPNMSKETIEKRTKTIKQTHSKGIEYYNKVKSGDLVLEDVPEKYKIIVEYRMNSVAWNKGKLQGEVDYSYLKGVPKTVTEKSLQARKNNSENARERYPNIFVYDLQGNFLKEFRSAPDIEEWSATESNNFPIVSRFKKERMGVPLNKLLGVCVTKAVIHKSTYKGLFFLTKEDNIEEIINNLKKL
jgi:group I intron endonuclease|nr:MAG TPA: intron associated endonuclease [Caudoviricetes sp.]